MKQFLDYGPANSVVQVGCSILFFLVMMYKYLKESCFHIDKLVSVSSLMDFYFFFFKLFSFCGVGAESNVDT